MRGENRSEVIQEMDTRTCKESVNRVGAKKEGSRTQARVGKKEDNPKWYEYEK
jgi:hypothetical protein